MAWLLFTKSSPTLCDPMNCSSPGFSVHGISQARVPEWVAIPFSRGSSQPRDQTQVSHIGGRLFTVRATREALLTMPKPLTAWITTSCGKFLMRWEYQTTWPASWEICIQVKKQQSIGHETMDWFQIGKGVWQGCILLLCLFNFYAEYIMQNARLDEAQAGIKIAGRNINNLSMQMIPPLWQKTKKN